METDIPSFSDTLDNSLCLNKEYLPALVLFPGIFVSVWSPLFSSSAIIFMALSLEGEREGERKCVCINVN